MSYNGYTGRKGNEYDLSGEYGIGYCSPHGEPFYFDLEDYDKVKKYTWGARHDKKAGHYYIESTYSYKENGKRKSRRIHLHHLVLGYDDKELNEKNIRILVDHKNQLPYDCQKRNLRISNDRGNNINKTLQTSNTSDFIGVTFNRKHSNWAARICPQKDKRITLGNYKDKDDAIRARLYGEYRYYGEYAPQKHLFEEYNITEETTNSFFKEREKGLPTHNTSGVVGIFYESGSKRWIAYMRINGKQTYLGSAKNKNDAAKIRFLAEKKYCPEDRWQKALWEEYGFEG